MKEQDLINLVCLQSLKEHNHVFAHAQDFDFWTGGQDFKDAGLQK